MNKFFKYTLKSSRQFSVQSKQSASLCRMEEFYNSVLAEDLMILTYDHRRANPSSLYSRDIGILDRQVNDEFDNFVKTKQMERKSCVNSTESNFKKGEEMKKLTNGTETDSYKKLLDPLRMEKENLRIYEDLPFITEVFVEMPMIQAISHSKKVLYNGLLALQLVTGQHAKVKVSKVSDSKSRLRKGMMCGVEVKLREPRVFYNFLDKLVEIVMPNLRDFKGFSKSIGNGIEENNLKEFYEFKFDFGAEAWQSFPEISAAYQMFPQDGVVGCLQPFSVTIKTFSGLDEEASRLLLSGLRIPINIKEKIEPPIETPVEEFVHDV